jgi:hypothetical protein
MERIKIIELPCFVDIEKGNLVPIEENETIPFEIKRVYYIFAVPEGERRGFHAHRGLNQALICVNGSVTIHLRSAEESCDIVLNNPAKALLIGPMIWREMSDFTPGAVLLVLADKHYDKADYVRDLDDFLALSNIEED